MRRNLNAETPLDNRCFVLIVDLSFESDKGRRSMFRLDFPQILEVAGGAPSRLRAALNAALLDAASIVFVLGRGEPVFRD